MDKPRFKGGINTNRVKKRCHWYNLPLSPQETQGKGESGEGGVAEARVFKSEEWLMQPGDSAR